MVVAYFSEYTFDIDFEVYLLSLLSLYSSLPLICLNDGNRSVFVTVIVNGNNFDLLAEYYGCRDEGRCCGDCEQ